MSETVKTKEADSQLAVAKDTALNAISEIAEPSEIGLVHQLQADGERLVTHLFECTKPGYHGWFWFATLSRAPRSKTATVCEIGLLPGYDALLAPAWVPWSERMKDISDAEKAELESFEDIDMEDLEPDEAEPFEEDSAVLTEEAEEVVEADQA